MQAILVLTAVGLVAAVLALGRELGLGIFAPLVPAIAVLTPAALPVSEEIASNLLELHGREHGPDGRVFGASRRNLRSSNPRSKECGRHRAGLREPQGSHT